MMTKYSQPMKVLTGIMGFFLCAVFQADAQTTRGTGYPSSSASSANISRPYVPSGMIGDAIISSDPDTKQIIVIADEETAEHIKQVIHGLDRPKPQVLIKVVFLEATYNNNLDLGVEGNFNHKINDSTTGSAVNDFGLLSSGVLPTPPGAGLYSVLGKDFSATLRAIAQAGKTEILARPSILARNNQQATITLGQQVPLIIGATVSDLTGSVTSQTKYTQVGISLQVTPFITPDGMVEMIVSPSISQLADRTQWVPVATSGATTISAPVVDFRSADTVVMVPDGQTVVIGGLMKNSKTSTENKIPFLGDIPLLGHAFKRTVKNDTKTELIIFLTPHIVNQPSQLAGASANERRPQLSPKAFSEKELDQFLGTLPTKPAAPPAKTAAPAAPAPSHNKAGSNNPKGLR